MVRLDPAIVPRLLSRVAREQDGQGLSEYAFLLVLIAIACIVALTLLGGSLASILSSVAQRV
jgi:pilus assembly protein Flp/PilA